MDNTVIDLSWSTETYRAVILIQLSEEDVIPGIKAAIENDTFNYDPIFQQDEALSLVILFGVEDISNDHQYLPKGNDPLTVKKKNQ